MTTTREELAEAARAYLEALDRLDLDAVFSFFAEDADFIVQTGHVSVHGASAIREMWESFFRSHEKMEHRLASVVVDDTARKVATEQAFTGVLTDGQTENRYSAYIFDFDESGKFSRVIVWIDGETPARG